MNREEILAAIKEQIRSVEPNAEVMLFGSRARGDWKEESDWDILVLTSFQVTYQLKNRMYDAVYPVSEKIFSFINIVVANKHDWSDHPGWYSLFVSIQDDLFIL